MSEETKLRDSLIGEVVGGCLLEASVSSGGMGFVFRGRHLGLDKPVAVKVMTPQLARSIEFRERFAREARIAGAIEHPNVVPVYGVGETGDHSYIIMRYLDGAPLHRLLTRQGMDLLMAARLGEQIALALAAVHRAGYVHRDVKPENILLTQRGEAFLTDFGVATEEGQSKPPGRGGSPPYMSPEQCRGEPLDGRSDVYSLGVTLYQSLAGRRPFLATTTAGLMLQHQQDKPPALQILRQDAHPEIIALIEQMLAKAPGDRPFPASELASRFADVQDGLRALRRASSMLIQKRPPGDTAMRGHSVDREDEEQEIEARVEQVEMGLLAMRDDETMFAPGNGGGEGGDRERRRGIDAFARSQYQKAVEYLDRALGFRRDDVRVLVTRGMAKRRMGDVDGAEADYRRALTIEPKNVRAMSALGALLRHKGLTGEAEKLLLSAIGADPASVEARITLGRLYEKAGSPGMARRQYEAAMEGNLHDERPFVALAALLVGQGMTGAAKGYLGSARERNPGSAPALFWLAAVSALEGKQESALKLLEESVKSGLRDASLLEEVEAFSGMRGHPRFVALLRLMRQGGSEHLFAEEEEIAEPPDVEL